MPKHQQTQQSKDSDLSAQRRTMSASQMHVSSPVSIIQRARIDSKSLTPADVMQLQRTIGNKAVGRLLSGIGSLSSTVQQTPIQRQGISEEEEPLQTKRKNDTGMPDNLKTGVENLSEIDMSAVRVHYNSLKPAEIGALAYTKGTDIHVAPGQEKHLPHETWHVVQQAQGRVKPTMQLKNVAVNDNVGLEKEADVMGTKSLQMRCANWVATCPAAQTKAAEPQEKKLSGATDFSGATIGTAAKKVNFDFLSSGTEVTQLMGRNVTYLGPEIQVTMYRGSDNPWEFRAMAKGRLFSKGDRDMASLAPLERVAYRRKGKFGEEGRQQHKSNSYDPPSNYVSLTDSLAQAQNWAQKIIYKMDIWRSDLWKGGVEDEWLAEGGTHIYNVEISNDRGKTWQDFATLGPEETMGSEMTPSGRTYSEEVTQGTRYPD